MTSVNALNHRTDEHASAGATTAPPDGALTRAPSSTSAATPPDGSPNVTQPQPPVATPPVHRYRKWLLLAGAVAALAVGGYFLVPWVDTALNTVSTDDAYVNGHVTLVAPRVSGQVMKVLVDDNQRVKKGDLLVQLDKEPFQVQVALKRTAVRVAEANLAAAESKARGLEAQLGSQRWKLQNASEQVDAQVALLRSQVAALRTSGGHSRPSPGRLQARPGAVAGRVPSAVRTSTSASSSCGSRQPPSTQAQEAIAQIRVSLGLPPQPEKGKEPHRRAAGPEPDLLRGPSGPGRLHADDDPARAAAGVHRPDAEPGPRRVSPARQGREH